MKRTRIELRAAGLAAALTGLSMVLSWAISPLGHISASDARQEAELYLGGELQVLELSGQMGRTTQWVVSDGEDKAWLDATTGDLIEIRFSGN